MGFKLDLSNVTKKWNASIMEIKYFLVIHNVVSSQGKSKGLSANEYMLLKNSTCATEK